MTTTTTNDNNIITLPDLRPLDDNYEAVHGFTSYANWLIPGHLMVGRYPFLEPSGRVKTRKDAEAQIRTLVQSGLITYVCLQAELPPQKDIPLRGVDGFLPYKACALIEASTHYGPPPADEIVKLRNRDLDKFLPPRRKARKFVDTRPELDFLHFGIRDLETPTSAAELDVIVDTVAGRVLRGERVYMHCWGGRGRAGTIGACLLAKLYGIDAEEALTRVQRAFDTRKDNGRKSPETEQQYDAVRNYCARMQN